VKRLQMLQK